jgi:hypothetical protein
MSMQRADPDVVRRRVAHELYGRLAFASAAIWALGTLILFVNFAAGNPRPIPMAAMSLSLPLVPAALIWLLYRPLTTHLTERRLRQIGSAPPAPPSWGELPPPRIGGPGGR